MDAVTISTHVLDTAAGRPAAGVRVELYAPDGGLVGDGVTDDDGRIRALGEGERRRLPDRLPPAVAVLPPGRARRGARRRSPPRPAPDLAVRMRELPRKLTRRRAGGALRGPHALRRAARGARRPARPRARGRPRALRRGQEGGSRRAPGDRRASGGALGAVGGRAGGGRCAAGARRAEPPLRGALRLPVRRLREPPPEGRARPDPPGAARAVAGGGAGDGARRAGVDRDRPMAQLLAISDYWWDWANLGLPLAARDRGDRVDRHVVLLHRARQPPAAAGGAARRRARRRRRVVGDPRRRLLPGREVPRRARDAPGAAALVQVGGVHDVALRVRVARRRLLRPRGHLPRRPERRATSRRGRRSRSRSPASLSRGSSTTGCAACSRGGRCVLAACVFAFVDGLGVGGDGAVRAAGGVRPGRRDDRDDDGRQRLLRDHPGALGARAREGGRPRARSRGERARKAALGAQQLPDAAGGVRDARRTTSRSPTGTGAAGSCSSC